MSKAFGLVLMVISLYIGMTIYQKGLDHAFDGALAPVEPVAGGGEPVASHLTAGAQMSAPPTDRERRVWVTDAVRESVKGNLERGAKRRGY